MAEPPASGAAAELRITITRVFDAPRERVWKQWTEPERFADWFGGLFQQHGRMSAKQYERSGEGWSSFFGRMAEHLADAWARGC